MKKVFFGLFLIFNFLSADPEFSITNENGIKQTAKNMESITLNVGNSNSADFKLEAKKIVSAWYGFMLNNQSDSNLLIKFDAAKNQITKDQSPYDKQILFRAGTPNDFWIKPLIAATSCKVDKSSKNRATNTFFIANSKEQSVLFFYIRNCETGEIINIDTINDFNEVDFDASFLTTKTSSSQINTGHSGKDGIGGELRLRTVIIAKEATRHLSTDYGYGEEFICKNNSNINTITLFDGNGNDITNKINLKLDQTSTNITFTIPNDDIINYKKMYFKLTCKKYDVSTQKTQFYYFDARPKEIQVSGLPNESDWLYAEYEYKSDGQTYKIEPFDPSIILTNTNPELEKYKLLANSMEKNKVMKAITLKAVDNNGVEVKNFNSTTNIAIVGKIYGDGDNGTINELLGDKPTLNRACTTGSKDGCSIATAVIDQTGSKIYTHISNNGQEVLSYNNVGKTVLYGVETRWTEFSQQQGMLSSIDKEQVNGVKSSTLCANGESHNNEKATIIAGKSYDLIGCYIPFVNPNSKEPDIIDFYEFKPAVYSLVFNNKNSPANDSYGADKFTYMRTITKDDFEFETADFNASLLAIGASLESLKDERALSHYDNHLKVADKLKFSGSPVNPTITLDGNSKQNDIAADFIITANNDKADMNGALMATLTPKNNYDHSKGYENTATLVEIKSKDDLVINREKDSFYAGRNIKVNKLNFTREDLLARSYIHLGFASVNIDITDPKNEQLYEKIKNDKTAFVFSYKGDDINIIDAAIIAPNLASNETTTDGAVYLAGYCEPTSRANCTEKDVFVSNTIAGHMSYFGFDFLVYGKHDPDIKESSTDGLFEYGGATFAQFKNGADFLSSFEANEANEVTIMLKGDQAEDYCKIFRNCYKLENGKFGTTFNSYKASITQWYGSGDKQGKTIVDNIAKDGKNTRRKEQRLSF